MHEASYSKPQETPNCVSLTLIYLSIESIN